MAKLTSVSRRQRLPGYRGKVMIDVVRGTLRVRKWPRKRGKPTSAAQQYWVDWFTQANKLAKYADAASQRRAIEVTANSGMYPRDYLLSLMRGTMYTWIDQFGWRWFPMKAVQDISESLDVLAQTVGDVLVRAVDRWRPAAGAAVGRVLTHQGPGVPPLWVDPTTGSGVSQVELAGTPIVPDGTQSQYDLAVSTYAEIDITVEGLGFAASDSLHLRFSTDGGVTYKAGAADYFATYLTASTMASGSGSAANLSYGAASSNHNAVFRLTNLRAGRAVVAGDCTTSGSNAAHRSTRVAFAGPITHIRLKSGSGNNLNAGTLRLVGLVAA